MKARANIPNENSNKVVATAKSQKTGNIVSQLKDNRSETATQKKMQLMANNSLQVQQTAQLQEMADQYIETLPAVVQSKRSGPVTQLKLISGSEGLETVARKIRPAVIQRVVQPFVEGGENPPGGKKGEWYSTVTQLWYPAKGMAERAEAAALKKQASVAAKQEASAKVEDEAQSSSDGAAAASSGKEKAPAMDAREKEARQRICTMIAKELAVEYAMKQPGLGHKAETAAFSIFIRQKFPIKGARPMPADIEEATNMVSVDEFAHIYGLAQQRKANWGRKDRFIEHAGPYKTFSPSHEHFYDEAYRVAEGEVELWQEFLNRDIILGKKSEIAAIKETIQRIQADLARGGPEIGQLLERVSLNSVLTAERMKLSNTVAGAGHQEKLDAGKGTEVATTTPEGKQWQHADHFMMRHVGPGNIGELPQARPELTPEFIMQINASESSEKGLVNSQAAGELRYSAIPLGSKKGGYNLRLVPPSQIALRLAGLVNGINEQLTHIKKPEDIWEIIPIAARFYTDFIAIHPFPDGNGRTARKVVDFLLLSYGLPPAQFDNATKNFGAGIPDVAGPMQLERPHSDLDGVRHVLAAVMKSFETLMSAK